ncbi:MAG: hypothetical protein CMB08_06215 [Euryarchaeota archaeon]|nr:hypothetical protein [Euryarchaeota archaeon]|tara:strand:+ start:1170 stop:1472 length:303 start_codon:yes stop_codon:yes gene_type:complete
MVLNMENTLLTVEKIERYLLITSKARAKATPITVNKDEEEKLSIMLRMCDDYTSDARHFLASGNLIDAFGAINYAHAWIDAAVKIGFLDGHDDDILFTLP